jgi:hypothetical protein
MASQWNSKAGGNGDSRSSSETSGEHSRRIFEAGSSHSSDPAFDGLCRVLIALSVLLLLGLVVLVGFTLSSDIDWDASVVKVDSGDQIQNESHPPVPEAAREVIRFDSSRLDEQGLVGPADGLRALSYEFCIPAVEAHVSEVESIDATIAIQRSSPGRIGCGEAEYLAIGNTHQADFRKVLARLSRLPYVDSIEEAHFE